MNNMADETFDSKPAVVPQQDVTARPPAAPDMGSETVPGDASAASIGGSQPTPPTPKGTQANTDPNAVPGSVEPHHGLLASIFQDLAGGKKTTYRQTENGPVAVKENLAPGEMARGILAAALTGLAAGYSPSVRGKGPGAAASAGFKAVEEQKQQQDETKKSDAQKEFSNKNVADEMTIRKMANARDQQRSIDLAQEHAIHMDQAKQALEQGKTEFSERTLEFQQKQADRMNLLSTLGAKPLTYADGKPVEEFNSPEEAAAWANKNAELAIGPGKYNTVFEVDPVTNRYVIMKKPLSWDDPQWIGVKTDPKTGQPIKDKNGDMIPDGNFKGTNGKVQVPAGQMTPHQMYDSQTRLLDLQNKMLTREEMLERIKNMRHERAKDREQEVADKEYNLAQGNPDAIDPKTGNFIVSSSSRTILQQRFIKEAAMQTGLLNAVQKEMDKMGVPSASAPDDEKRQYAEMQQQASEARQNLHQLQINMGLLGRTPNVADVTAGTVRSQYTHDDGSYDEKGAMESVDKMTAPSAVKQQIRQKLSSEPQNRPAQQLDAVVGAISSLAPEQQIENINKAPLSKHDKDYLFSKLKSGQAGAAASKVDLTNVDPSMTVFTSPSGGTELIPNDAADAFTQSHPNYKRVGSGTKNSSAPDSESGAGGLSQK